MGSHGASDEPSNAPQEVITSVKDDIGLIVMVTIVVLILFQAGPSVAVAKAIKQGLDPELSDYVQFTFIYVSTIFLSSTVTIAVAACTVPRMYGVDVDWGFVPGIVFVGAVLTSSVLKLPLPIRWTMIAHAHGRAGLIFLLFVALAFFAHIYGASFLGGVIVGSAGGLIISTIVHHNRRSKADQKPLPWGEGVTGVIALLIAAAAVILILRSFSELPKTY
jgi:hypothetical protein